MTHSPALRRRRAYVWDSDLRSTRVRGYGTEWKCRWCGATGTEISHAAARWALGAHRHDCPKRPDAC